MLTTVFILYSVVADVQYFFFKFNLHTSHIYKTHIFIINIIAITILK